MSHFQQREEKECLNCGTEVMGRYCHVCGQENIEPRESVWHLILHFFYDITHFDGKFFSTSKRLFFKPGFLPREYMLGRRASYLNPIRMYIFTSAFFFLMFFSFFFRIDEQKFSEIDREISAISQQLGDSGKVNINSSTGILTVNGNIVGNMYEDDLPYRQFRDSLRKVYELRTSGKDTTEKKETDTSFGWVQTNYKTRKAYDSAQKSLSPDLRDSWLKRIMVYRKIEVQEKYGGNAGVFLARLIDKFLHLLPTLMFVSLPLFALILQLLYMRRKEFYYVNHLIFSIHYYIFSFLMMLLFFGFEKLDEKVPSGVWDLIELFIWLLIFFYLYKAMRNFYKQRRFKTIIKFLVLNLLSFLVAIILFSIFALYTAIYA